MEFSGESYSDYAPFESRAMDLMSELGLLSKSHFAPETSPTLVLVLTLYKPGTEFEIDFSYDGKTTLEEFWKLVADRLEIAQVIDEIPSVDG